MVWHLEEAKQQFIRRVEELGNHAAACREFGIHPSTGHRWRNAVLATEPELTKRAPSRARISDSALHKAIKQQVWLNPADSCLGYSKALSGLGMSVSSTTIQKLLNEWGLRRLEDRLDAVEERKLDTGESLPLSTREALKKAGRMLEAANFDVTYPGQVIAISRIQWAKKSDRFPYLLLAVDVYSMTIRCKLWDGETMGAEILLFQAITEFLRRRLFLKNPSRKIRSGKTFAEIGGHQFRLIVVAPEGKSGSTAADSLVTHVAGVMRTELFPLLKKSTEQISSGGYLEGLSRWEWDFNVEYRFSGFPNFGLSPMQRVLAYEAELRMGSDNAQ